MTIEGGFEDESVHVANPIKETVAPLREDETLCHWSPQIYPGPREREREREKEREKEEMT